MAILRDVMSRSFEAVHPDAPLADALRKLEALNLGMLPVCDDGRLVGALSGRLLDTPQRPPGRTVRELMSPEVLTGRVDQDLKEVVERMRASDVHSLPVLDGDERMVGIFTLGGPWKRHRS